MKKILCYLATALLCVFIVGCAEEKENIPTEMPTQQATEVETQAPTDPLTEAPKAQDLSLYIPYVEDVLDKHEYDYSTNNAKGVLCDIDENGIEELIVTYSVHDGKNLHDPSQLNPCDVYDIYTMDTESVVTLLEKETLYSLAGGPNGDFYLLHNADENLLAVKYTEVNPGSGEELYNIGDWNFYKIDGTEFKEVKTVKYTIVADYSGNTDYDKSTVTENSTEKPYKEFEDWLNGYESVFLFNSMDNVDSTDLETLLSELK